MKAMWHLPAGEIAKDQLAERAVEVVLVEFDGPQIVCVWGPGGARRLSVACDEDAAAVRWVEAELSAPQWNALFEGKLALRDALRQPRGWVVDEARTGEALRAWEVSPVDLDPALLPERGALLPTEVRQRFVAGPTVAPVELREKDAAVERGFPDLPRMVA
jgi:hypothetical protein